MWRAASSFVPHLTLADASTQRPHRCRQGLNRRAHRRVLRRLVLDQSPAPPSHSVRLFRSPLQLARSPHERSYTLIQLRYSGDVLVEEPKLRPWTSALVRAGSASPDRHAPRAPRRRYCRPRRCGDDIYSARGGPASLKSPKGLASFLVLQPRTSISERTSCCRNGSIKNDATDALRRCRSGRFAEPAGRRFSCLRLAPLGRRLQALRLNQKRHRPRRLPPDVRPGCFPRCAVRSAAGRRLAASEAAQPEHDILRRQLPGNRIFPLRELPSMRF